MALKKGATQSLSSDGNLAVIRVFAVYPVTFSARFADGITDAAARKWCLRNGAATKPIPLDSCAKLRPLPKRQTDPTLPST
jgi:hypothetical protein